MTPDWALIGSYLLRATVPGLMVFGIWRAFSTSTPESLHEALRKERDSGDW